MTFEISQRLIKANPAFAPVIDFARQLHGDVSYGKSHMLDQVLAVAAIVHDATGGNVELTGAALLHKSLEAKRIKSGVPAQVAEIEALVGPVAAAAIQELQDYDSRTDDLGQAEKVQGAAALSAVAKTILVAEKIANFETSIHNPNPAKPPEWHAKYFATRIEVGRAAADAHPQLAKRLEERYAEGVALLQKPQASAQKPRAAAPG